MCSNLSLSQEPLQCCVCPCDAHKMHVHSYRMSKSGHREQAHPCQCSSRMLQRSAGPSCLRS